MTEVTVNTEGFDKLLRDLPGELTQGVSASAWRLKFLAEQNVEQVGATDTFALKESLYVSTPKESTYVNSVANASQAYASNPTKWPEIRKATEGRLEIDPEATPRNQYESYMGYAASHGKAVEEGYVSYYGNDVPARPAIEITAQEGFPVVVDEIRRAVLRALL